MCRRQVRVDRQVDADVLGLLGGGDRLAVGGGPVGLDGLPHQAHVEVEAHPGDVAGLLGAQDVAGAANLKSFNATAIPAPSSLFCAMVASRS